MADKTLQVVLLPVFLVFLVVERTVLVRLPLVICAVLVACSLLPKFGANGTSRSTKAKSKASGVAALGRQRYQTLTWF